LAVLRIVVARSYALRGRSTLARLQPRESLLRWLQLPVHATRASVVEGNGARSRTNCGFHGGQKHGPRYSLTRCLTPGRMHKFLPKTAFSQRSARSATGAFNEFCEGFAEPLQINTQRRLRRGQNLQAQP